MNLRQILYIVCLLTTVILASSLFVERCTAYDTLAGFQIDSRGQYFAYTGFQVPVGRPDWIVEPFVSVFAVRQNYYFYSEGQLLEGRLSQFVPAVGVRKSLGGLNLSLSGGPSLLYAQDDSAWTDENGALVKEKVKTQDVGYSMTGYSSYRSGAHKFEGLLSYSNPELFFGRFRWMHYDYKMERGTPITPGLELLAVGNANFQTLNAGLLVGSEFGKLQILLKGGYQNNTTFHSGGYGGIELYMHY